MTPPPREQLPKQEHTFAALEDAVADKHRLAGATLDVFNLTEAGRDHLAVHGR